VRRGRKKEEKRKSGDDEESDVSDEEETASRVGSAKGKGRSDWGEKVVSEG
jgi:hypothetical protein